MSRPAESSIRCAAALSLEADSSAAVADVCDRASADLQDEADLALLFLSAHHAPAAETLSGQLRARLGPAALLGCTGESIVGEDREIEMAPAVSLWLAKLPGAAVQTFSLAFNQTPDGGVFHGWPPALEGAWPEDATLLLLGDPFSFPAELLLERLNEDRPGAAVLGGMASGGAAPGENQLLLGDQARNTGAVAALVSGVRIRSVTSQGCRPIGAPLVITKAEQNVLLELGGRPAMTQLQEIFRGLPAHDQQLVNRGLHIGQVMSEYQSRFEQGDFLIKNVIGADPDRGAIAVGDYLRVGRTVQFHVRDEQSADAELRQLLAAAGAARGSFAGGLLFTCNGRGTRTFSTPHHDAACVQDALGGLPLAGFFAQGEIGPVSGRNYLHGFTASLALFEAD